MIFIVTTKSYGTTNRWQNATASVQVTRMGGYVQESDIFGVWLRRRRKAVLGVTQTELADRVACSETMIGKIERGERRPARDLAERLMKAMRIEPENFDVYVAWARGLTLEDDLAIKQQLSQSGKVQLSTSNDETLWVLVPLDAIASFGPEPSTVVQLGEAFHGRLHWVPVPLAALTTFGLKPPCWEGGCNGQDPEISGCAREAVTVDGSEILDRESGIVTGTVELRYARACQTNWVRVTRLCREGRHLQAYLRDEVGKIIEPTQAETSSISVYGPMWFAPTGKVRVQACGIIDGCEEVCTNLH